MRCSEDVKYEDELCRLTTNHSHLVIEVHDVVCYDEDTFAVELHQWKTVFENYYKFIQHQVTIVTTCTYICLLGMLDVVMVAGVVMAINVDEGAVNSEEEGMP